MKLLLVIASLCLTANAGAQTSKIKASSKSNKRTPAQTTAKNVIQLETNEVTSSTSATASNFFYQPQESVSILELRPYQSTTQTSMRLSSTADSVTSSTKSSAIEISYKRGLANNKALSISSSIGSDEINPGDSSIKSYKNAGFSDFKIEISKMNNRENDEQILGAFATVSMGPAETGYEYTSPGSERNADGNRYSGGHSFSGYYGVQKKSAVNESVFGTKVTGTLQLPTEQNTRDSSNQKVSTTTDGGHALFGEIFSETKKGPVLLGFTGGLGFVLPISYSVEAGGTKSNFKFDRQTYLKAEAYGVVATNNKKISILPSFGLRKLVSATDGPESLENNDEVRISVLTRIAL